MKVELTRDELVRVIEGLGLLMDEAQEEQDKENRHLRSCSPAGEG